MRTAIIPGVTSEPTDPSCDNAPQVLYWFTLKKIIIIKKRKQSGFFYMVITWELCSLTAILLEKWGWKVGRGAEEQTCMCAVWICASWGPGLGRAMQKHLCLPETHVVHVVQRVPCFGATQDRRVIAPAAGDWRQVEGGAWSAMWE